MSRAYNRDISRRKALRKRRIAREIYRYWKRYSEDDNWEYFDNLHQYSKNAIHCSCPACSGKTRNKGKRRYKSGNYAPGINYKASDLRKVITMDQDELEVFGIENPKRQSKRL
jgi:hypothetical protein